MIVAHRGASATEAENTLVAFEAAIRAGAEAVEFDVRMTADGHAVVMHDADVARTTDRSGLVRSMTLREVKRLRIRTSDGGATEVPTLDESLELLSGRAFVDIEIKNIPGQPDFDADGEPAVEATLTSLQRSGFSGGVLLTSFNPFSLARSRILAPDVPTGLLTQRDVDVVAALGYAYEQEHPWLLPCTENTLAAGEAFVAKAHGYGMRIGAWLTDDPAEATALFSMGVDAVATNNPAVLVTARGRGSA